MRLSRNRNWGHPNLIKFLERFSEKTPKLGWGNGLLVGDLAQPRGGPMLTGHWSHQVGLDADIWFSPMPNRELTRQEREEMSATNIVADDWKDVNPKIWSPAHIALLKIAAKDNEVERVLVNPAIKKALCRDVKGDRSWLHKVRPVYRTQLPLPYPHRLSRGTGGLQGATGRAGRRRLRQGSGCVVHQKALYPKPGPGRPPFKMSALPAACKPGPVGASNAS